MENKQIKLTESEFNNLIQESVIQALNEGGFWNNVQGAVQGAYSGYKARQSANRQFGSSNGSMNNQKISMTLNNLYETVGWLAEEWSKKGWSMKERELPDYINRIEKSLWQLKQLAGTFNNR